MNLAVISSRSTYHHIAQLFLKDSNIDKVYHYGAPPPTLRSIENHSCILETDRYKPCPIDLIDESSITEDLMRPILYDMKDKSIDFVLASGLTIPSWDSVYNFLEDNNIHPGFVYPKLSNLEKDKKMCRSMLNKLNIPTPEYEIITGEHLFSNYHKLKTPFVLRLPKYYQGRQTIIVTENNSSSVYEDLFSYKTIGIAKEMNLGFSQLVIFEKFIKIKREYSYHMAVNKKDWKFIGAVRDYKTFEENDQGFNTDGVGGYNVNDIDIKVHEYAEKIFLYLKDYLGKIEKYYRGFMYLGIAITDDDVPMILEINTRGGDPELSVLLQTLETSIADITYAMSSNKDFPKIKFNSNKIVAVKLYNKFYNKADPAHYLPFLKSSPEDIIHGVQGSLFSYRFNDIFTTTGETHEIAAKKIFRYLDQQRLGQYRYRKDIGILK